MLRAKVSKSIDHDQETDKMNDVHRRRDSKKSISESYCKRPLGFTEVSILLAFLITEQLTGYREEDVLSHL